MMSCFDDDVKEEDVELMEEAHCFQFFMFVLNGRFELKHRAANIGEFVVLMLICRLSFFPSQLNLISCRLQCSIVRSLPLVLSFDVNLLFPMMLHDG